MDSNLLRMIADPYVGDPAEARYRGAQQGSAMAGFARDREVNALAPMAAQGDQNALARLTGIDPQRASQITQATGDNQTSLMKQGLQMMLQADTPQAWEQFRQQAIEKTGQDHFGDFSQRQQHIASVTAALDPNAAANRAVTMAQMNKPSIERVQDPMTGAVSFMRVSPYSGSAQPVQTGGGAPGGDGQNALAGYAYGNPQPGGNALAGYSNPPPAAAPPMPMATGAPPTGAGAPARATGGVIPASNRDNPKISLNGQPAPMPGSMPQAGPAVGQPTAAAGASNNPNAPQPLDPAIEAQLARLPASYQPIIRGLLNYSTDPRLERAAGRGNAIGMAQSIDPTYNPAQFPAIQGTIKGFANGSQAQAVTSLNKVAGHLGSMWDGISSLGNVDWPVGASIANAIGNTVKGSGSSGKALAAFDQDVLAVGTEIAKAMRGTGAVGEGEINAWKAGLTRNASPTQIMATLKAGVDLLDSQASALGDQYTRGTNGKTMPIFSPKAQAILDKIRNWDGGAPPAAGQGGGAAPPGGTQLQAGSQQNPLQVDNIDYARQLPSGTFFTINGKLRQVK